MQTKHKGEKQTRVTLTIAASLICLPINALSEDLLGCVNPDVAIAFLSAGNQSGRTISDELPQEFSLVQLPEDFLFIGSSKSATLTKIAFRTGRVPSDAVSVVENMFHERGWSSVSQPKRNVMRKGFQEARDSSLRQLSLCHTNGKSMAVTSREGDRGTYVMLWRSSDTRNINCNQEVRADRSMDWGLTSDLMPNLELPAGAISGGSGRGGIIRGSGDDADTHVRIRSKLRPEEILSNFSNQLVLQGWILDSTWTGEASRGNVWSLSRETLPKTVGTLHLVTHSEGDYTVKFSMLAL